MSSVRLSQLTNGLRSLSLGNTSAKLSGNARCFSSSRLVLETPSSTPVSALIQSQPSYSIFNKTGINPEMEKLRVVPKERNFYAANPPHEEHMATLQATLRKYINLPTVPREEAMAINWSNYAQYKIIGGGTRLKPLQYKNLIKVLNRLSLIDPQLMPDEVVETIRPFMRDTQSVNSVQKIKSLDQFGRAINVGRRKNSSATVQVVRSTESIMGQIIVNGKTLDEFFPKLSDRQTIVYPLKVVNSITNFNIFATVQGGGSTGQAGAVAEGITKTLIMFNPLFKHRLRKAGCATHDSRVVERKKPGRKKARKMPTWVKR